MNTFEIGEVAIVHSPGFPWHGHECTILSKLEYWQTVDGVFDLFYRIDTPGFFGLSFAKPKTLRKRRPPWDWEKLCQLDILEEVT